MLRSSLLSILIILIFGSCQQASSVAHISSSTAPITTNSQATILNNIVVHEAGELHIERAYLTNENNNLLNTANTVQANQPVYLNLLVKDGWLAENDSVSLGATQSIQSTKGESLLVTNDLFASTPRLFAGDANFIRLRSLVAKAVADTQTILVNYRVWDKLGKAEVTGNYALHLTK